MTVTKTLETPAVPVPTEECDHSGYVMRRHPDGERYRDVEAEQPFCRRCNEFVEL